MDEQQWATWHGQHERQLADPHGFLAITSLNFLTAEPQLFPDAPGTWHTGPDGVVVELADDESLTLDGVTLIGRHSFGVLAERSSIYPGVRRRRDRGGQARRLRRHPATAPVEPAARSVPRHARLRPADEWDRPAASCPSTSPATSPT
jgi:uncharacterized protein